MYMYDPILYFGLLCKFVLSFFLSFLSFFLSFFLSILPTTFKIYRSVNETSKNCPKLPITTSQSQEYKINTSKYLFCNDACWRKAGNGPAWDSGTREYFRHFVSLLTDPLLFMSNLVAWWNILREYQSLLRPLFSDLCLLTLSIFLTGTQTVSLSSCQ